MPVLARSEGPGDRPPMGAWLVGGGEMGACVRATDWSATPLGPIDFWPQSLRTTVSLCLASNFPISLAWGAGHVQIYNDGYWPICGEKHPHSLGQDFTTCWASAWPVIGEAFERAMSGLKSFLEDQRMFLDRNGYLEETFFTFSFSPIYDESGGIGGLFHPVTETTAKMIGERRTRALRDLAAATARARTTDEAFTLAVRTLNQYPLDVPFALVNQLDASGSEGRLIAQTDGLPPEIAVPVLGPTPPPTSRRPCAGCQMRPRWPCRRSRRRLTPTSRSIGGRGSCGPTTTRTCATTSAAS